MLEELLWNVDTQKDFMDSDGKLSVKDAQEIRANLSRITQYKRGNEVTSVNTADWHNEYSKELSKEPDFETTFPEHCMANTPGAEYIPETQPDSPYIIDWDSKTLDEKALAAHKGDIVIRKDEFDVFTGNPHTFRVLDILNPKRVIVYGVATNVCVDQAVMGLAGREGIKVYVVEDAIRGLPNMPIEPVINKWLDKGVKLITTDQLVSGQYLQPGK